MKAFLILVILAAVGWFGYQWYSAEAVEADSAQEHSESAEAEGTDETQLVAPFPSRRESAGTSSNSGNASNSRSSSNNESAASAPQRSSSANGSGAALPPRMQELRERTDARWQQIMDAGRNPVAHAQTVAMARDYSRVLQATYGHPGLAGVAEELIAERLNPIAKSLFFSSTPLLDDESGFVQQHVVQSGESPDRIGRQYGMSYQFINILRGADPESGNISVGDRLKVFDLNESGYHMHIGKSDFRLDLYIGDIFARRYDVGIGEDITPTPAGTTHITAREREPQWTDPQTNRVFDYGHPDHIIGPVWLAFDPKIGRNGLGIHGYTGSGNAVGTRESNGCVRMRNDEVRELYNILVRVSRAPMNVTIID